MSASPVKQNAFDQIELLEKVVDFKMKFYRSPWAKFEEATPGSFKLIPPEYRLAKLEDDHDKMRDMLYGDVPTLDTIMAALQELEREINTL